MDIGKLDKWAELLLDTGKRNNLINFKDTKLGTAEFAVPEFGVLFDKADRDTRFEVYDPKCENGEEGGAFGRLSYNLTETEYISAYGGRLKGNQVLLWNSSQTPVTALKNIAKKARTAIEETGVNIAYMAFGFVHWAESNEPEIKYRAPLLLIPVTIENKSPAEPIYIKPDGDEIILNPTFAFKLQGEYNLKLPEYGDEGIESYIKNIEEILSKLNWSVTRECKIGIFSFQKINMYRDLKDNAEIILKNENVRILLGEESAKGLSPEDMRGQSGEDLLDLQNVVDADSSQAEAIKLAKTGQSFVLQGPPGTGKSQTITNLIAECLSDGKKVLFVSEKLAALNVVYDKLKKAGLSEFCLELHSHKANKKEFIGELCRTLKLPKSSVSPKAAVHIRERKRMQEKLSGYEKELHSVRPVINKSLYNIFGEISSAGNFDEEGFLIADIANKGDIYLGEAVDALSQYADYIPSIDRNYKENAWYGYKNSDVSFTAKLRLKENLQVSAELCAGLSADGRRISEEFSVGCSTVRSVINAQKFFALAGKSNYLTPHMAGSALEKYAETVKKLSLIAKEILDLKGTLDGIFREEVYGLNGADYYNKLTNFYYGFFNRLFAKEYREIISSLRLCRRAGGKLKYAEALGYAETLCKFQKKTAEFEKLEAPLKDTFGRGYCGVNTDFALFASELSELSALSADGLNFGKIPSMPYEEFCRRQPEFLALAKAVYSRYSAGREGLENTLKDFDSKRFDFLTVPLKTAEEKCRRCLDNLDKLENWCAFIKLAERLEQLEIRSFIDFTIEKNIGAENIIPLFKKSFYSQWADNILRSTPSISELTRIPHDKAEAVFCENDKLQFEINKAEIKEKLSELRPSTELITAGGAVSILLREGEKKRRQKGVRTLMTEIGGLIQLLKPCFLMSPLSVSTFLASEEVRFDTIIFDEASQIFPQDAVGAIYRGKQLIVVGDSKQMPPSNFFNSVTDSSADGDGDSDIADFESILDLCSSALPQKRLKWHYRSRFEQLISFSNKNFYDGELVTFPSSKKDARGYGVDFYYTPDGVFDHASKTNLREAEFTVNLIYRNIEKYPRRSLGVVAFSISQQNLIEKLLSKRRQTEEDKEAFFKADNAEPFFVKNLETVQGDERDTIIFSVGYAKDSAGKLLHNFGPLNRTGGERRLNVAITRAKHNVQLVSSMKYTDIDLTRTRAEGARLLREYLDYAENGETALARGAQTNLFGKRDFDFETEVCGFLRENGFDADTQVGCSGFKIDVALKNPDTDGYALAIECDGENYHSYKTARDRDRLRREVLERMGWKYYRIWSADWFRNKRVEKEKLLNSAKEALASPAESAPATDFEAESFEEELAVKPFDFPEYVTADVDALRRRYPNNFQSFIKAVLETEAPLSEEWLLKRICHQFGREKVTSVVNYEYERRMARCEDNGIIRKDGFLYLAGRPSASFRRSGEALREIKYVSLEELSAGILQLLNLNVTVEKEGLYKTVAEQLGFTRTGEAIRYRLDCALSLIDDKIEINGGIISLK